MAKAKYIIVKEHGVEAPIVFCPILEHARIAANFLVSGAGFCAINDLNKLDTWGESTSLNIKSRPQDAEILNKLLHYS